jgi:hypothetical protein
METTTMNPMTETHQQPQEPQQLQVQSIFNTEEAVQPFMVKPELIETIPPRGSRLTDRKSVTGRPFKKRRRVEELLDSVEMSHNGCDRNSDVHCQVSWNDDKNVIHLQDDPFKVFPTEYKKSDVWYSVRGKNIKKTIIVSMVNSLQTQCHCILTSFLSVLQNPP